uniref:Fibronectin type-III domain-containing protein n=1 Tax=Strigamia maritima TaxID=126957 RepID=T1IZ09_STRMM
MMRFTWRLGDLKFIVIHSLLLYLNSPKFVFPMEDEFRPPHSVELEAQSDKSLTIGWKAPEVDENSPQIVSYSVHYYITPDSEKLETVSKDTRSKLLHNLQPATNYTIYVTAHYSGNKSASSLICVMSTSEGTSNSIFKDCSCFQPGTKRCDKINSGRCVCHIGYEGSECDICVKGFYLFGGECRPCPCSPESSFGTCQLGTEVSGEVTCACREGYFGSLCDMCVVGFYPVANGQCIKCSCLFCGLAGYTNPICNQCPQFANNFSNPLEVKTNCGVQGPPKGKQRTVDQGDGTVAVVAAVASLAFIACVAGGITCYRRHLQAHNQPPFWSIELTEDKITLSGSNSDYERLGEGSSKQHFRTSHHQRSPSVAEATAAQREANQPQYNCISI